MEDNSRMIVEALLGLFKQQYGASIKLEISVGPGAGSNNNGISLGWDDIKNFIDSLQKKEVIGDGIIGDGIGEEN